MTETHRHFNHPWLIVLLLIWPMVASPPAAAENADRFVGTVLFMRHALAPGTGDPDTFSINEIWEKMISKKNS